MPPPSLSLPSDLSRRLSRIRGLIGVSQTQLAEAAKVAQGTVSNLLQGARPVRASYARLVVIAIQQALERHLQIAALPAEQAHELRRPVVEALALIDGSAEERPRFALPGGAMHPDTINRVARKAIEDLLILRGLESHPATMRIDGPPQSGKSTLLRLVERAAVNRGMHVTYFDDAALDVTVKEQLAEHFFLQLARELAVSWGEEEPTDVSTANDLKEFVMRARRRATRSTAAVIIVDVPSHLPGIAQEEILDICRVLKSHASDLNLSWVIALQPPYERKSNWFRSSRGYFYPFVKLKGFGESEVLDLLQRYPTAARDTGLASWLLDLFGGQAFLTHVAIERINHGETTESVERLAIERSDYFGEHLARIEEAMGADLLAAVRSPDAASQTDDDDRKFLADMHIVNFVADSTGATLQEWTSRLYQSALGRTGSVAS